ncbi:MAG: TetR/AcrR family transcriptional regulator [Micropepsaceae bacterium]
MPDAIKLPPKTARPGGRTARVSAQIHEAALDLLAEQGFGALSLQALAGRAGVNRSTLYRRWPGRAQLVLEAILARLGGEVALADTGSLHGDLTALLRGIAAFLQSRLGRALLEAATAAEFGAELAAERQAIWRRRLADVMPLFDRALARGEIPSSADSEALLGMAAGALHFRLIVAGEPLDEAWIGRIAGLVTKAAH